MELALPICLCFSPQEGRKLYTSQTDSQPWEAKRVLMILTGAHTVVVAPSTINGQAQTIAFFVCVPGGQDLG